MLHNARTNVFRKAPHHSIKRMNVTRSLIAPFGTNSLTASWECSDALCASACRRSFGRKIVKAATSFDTSISVAGAASSLQGSVNSAVFSIPIIFLNQDIQNLRYCGFRTKFSASPTAAPTGYYDAASNRRENSLFGDLSYKPIGTASGLRPVRIIMPRPTRLVSTVSLAKRPPVNVPKAGNIRCSCPIKNAGRVAFLSRAFGW